MNLSHYGQGLLINKITCLTKEKFTEEVFIKLENTFIHHVSFIDDIIIFDWCDRSINDDSYLINNNIL